MDEFDRLFPKTAARFGTNAIAADRWRDEMQEGGIVVAGNFMLLSGDMLQRAVSWRQHSNLFSSPNFSMMFTRFREMYAVMAKQGFTRQQPEQKAQFSGFLEFRLNDEQLTELDEWQPTAMDIFAYGDKLIRSGIKISLSYNERTKLATCALLDEKRKTADGEKNPAAGKLLSTQDTDCALALKGMMYKHFLVLEGSWVSLLDQPSRGGQRG